MKRFEIDYLTIDRSFVHKLGFDSDNQALCEAILMRAQSLGLNVIAKGLESNDQRDFAAVAGCHFAQGFLYAASLPADQFEARV